MSDNTSDDDDITPVFAFRADNIMKKQREAYEEMLKKSKEEDMAKAVKDEENDLLVKIHEKLKKKPRRQRKTTLKTPVSKTEEKNLPVRKSNRRRNKEDEKKNEDNISKIEQQSPVNLPARAKKRLKKIDLENKRERKRINELNKRVLSSCYSSPVNDDNPSMDIEAEQNISLKINYLSEISKIAVNENEKFSSIISKVADLFKLKITEVILCLRDEIISLDATPLSLNVKTWDIIECVPYKSTNEMQDNTDSNKFPIKMQSNDCKKKIDIYVHKLENFQDIMERYANLRNLPLKNLIFEFDGERISGSDTPDDLDMESGICVDVKVIGSSKPTTPSITFVDLEKEMPPHEMLDICVLD